MTITDRDTLKLGLPKGRMQEGTFKILSDAGIKVRSTRRNYRPDVSIDGVEAKILKPHNIVRMLDAGTRDIGFAGADWVAELGAEVTELLDTRLDPVSLVAAAPRALLVDGRLPTRPLTVAAEYENLTQQWIDRRKLDAEFIRSYGATEVFPPEDADCIVDVTATGDTLRSNQLEIVDTLMVSSTRLYAYPRALDNPTKRRRIEDLVVVLSSVLEARQRVMLEVNVATDDLEALVDLIPSMRKATVSQLHGDSGFAIKSAIPRRVLPTLVPAIKARGGTDVVVYELSQIVP